VAQEMEQLIESLNDLVKRLNRVEKPKGKWANFGVFLNSAFVLTIIGGVILSVTSVYLQSKIAASQSIAQHNREIREQKRQVLSKFSDDIVRYLDLCLPVRKRAMWLASYQDAPDKLQQFYPDGRNFIQTRDQYELDKKALSDMRRSDAICSEVRATFETPNVKSKAAELDAIIGDLFNAKNYDELNSTLYKAEMKYKEVIDTMAEELVNSKP
jgi:hypothetical protein